MSPTNYIRETEEVTQVMPNSPKTWHPSDIKPHTPLTSLDRAHIETLEHSYCLDHVARAVGMSPLFVRKATGQKATLNAQHVLQLLDLDAYKETIIPRSQVLTYLTSLYQNPMDTNYTPNPSTYDLRLGNALNLIHTIPDSTIQCVVTSTPYWGTRTYEDVQATPWADGEICPYGLEQTPEGFVRHTTEVLDSLARVLTDDGSIWWNVMDSFNTRTQIRNSAVEALRAMEGKDSRKWNDHPIRRYSAGHSYLKDGEQCLIPALIAERASRIGLYVKSVITWAKRSTLPEPHNSRVSRNLEYVLHISKTRTPKFKKNTYLTAEPKFGGRDELYETEKLSDVWILNTSMGGNGHGAQFPTALPGRCIALSTEPGDIVLDPFVGSGTSGIVAIHHGCRFLGFDISQTYLNIAKERLERATKDCRPHDT